MDKSNGRKPARQANLAAKEMPDKVMRPPEVRAPLVLTVAVDPQSGAVSLALSNNAANQQDYKILADALALAERQLMELRIAEATKAGMQAIAQVKSDLPQPVAPPIETG